jgi:hypothetical protein
MSILDSRITKTGYVGFTQNQYYTYLIDRLKEIEPELNITESSIEGLLLAVYAEMYARLDEGLEAAYNSKNPNFATDHELDILCGITGKERKPASASQVILTFTGDPDTLIDTSATFRSQQNDFIWKPIEDVRIGANGSAQVTAKCTTLGEVIVDDDTITIPVTPKAGLEAVTNSNLIAGVAEQSDFHLRLERNKSVSIGGTSQMDAMYAHLYRLEEVKEVMIFENDRYPVDENGLPKNSIAVLVDGGSDEDVALEIFRTKTMGCAFHAIGTKVEVTVSDRYPKNQLKVIFGRPHSLPIQINLIVLDDGTLPLGIEDNLKTSIILYVEGTLPTTQFNRTGYNIGEDVAVSQLATPVNYELGTYGNSYVQQLVCQATIDGVSQNYSYGQVVPMKAYEKASFDQTRISITITSK